MMMTVGRAEPPRLIDKRGWSLMLEREGLPGGGGEDTRSLAETTGLSLFYPSTKKVRVFRHKLPAMATDPSLPQLALLVELVELENPSLIAARKYFINKVCFGRIRVSGLIGAFLNMLAFTLVKDTGLNETAAIGLDLGDPVDGLTLMSLESWRTATIRIVCDAGALDSAVGFAKEILAWMQEFQEGLPAISPSCTL